MTQGTNKSKLKTEALVILINMGLEGNVSHLNTQNPLNLAAGLIPAAWLPYLVSEYHTEYPQTRTFHK